MQNYWDSFRRFDRSIRLYLVYYAASAFSYVVVAGVLFNLYLLRLGYGPGFIGKAYGLAQLAAALFALPSGVIGAKIGVKRAILLGLLINALAVILLVASEELPTDWRSNGLLAAWVLCWIGGAMYSVNSIPYLMAVSKDQRTSMFAFSAQAAVMAVSGFIGGILAGLLPGILAGWLGSSLEQPAPYRFAMLIAPAATLLGAASFLRAQTVKLETPRSIASKKQPFPLAVMLFLGVIVFVQSANEGTVRAFFNVYLDSVHHVSAGQIGAAIGIPQLMVIIFSLAAPLVIQRWKAGGAIMAMALLMASATLLIAGLQAWWAAMLAYMLLIGVISILGTARSMFSQEIVDPRWRTAASAILMIGMALGWSVSAWLGGSLVSSIGYRSLFFFGSLFGLLSIGVMLLQSRIAQSQALHFEVRQEFRQAECE